MDDVDYTYTEIPVTGKNYSKLIRSDLSVAIILTQFHGAGWSTNYHTSCDKLLFDSRLANFLMDDQLYPEYRLLLNKENQIKWRRHKSTNNDLYHKFMTEIMQFDEHDIPCGYGFYALRVAFIEIGTVFRINEYDGQESVEILNMKDYHTA